MTKSVVQQEKKVREELCFSSHNYCFHWYGFYVAFVVCSTFDILLFADNYACSRFTSQVYKCAQVVVCGSNGLTYSTPCKLEEASCKAERKGLSPIKTLPIGRCRRSRKKRRGYFKHRSAIQRRSRHN